MNKPKQSIERGYNISILLITYNRLDTLKEVIQSIRLVKPKKIYIASDGPNKSKLGDQEQIKSVRDYLGIAVDWECKVFRNYKKENLGLKCTVKQSIDWFFETEEYGIILEDDVVPNLSFFNFVEHCLIKYQYNPEIVMISGNQFLPYNMIDEPYYFSSIFRIWGWATWKRAWLNIDLEIDNRDINQKNKLRRKYKKSFISGYIDQIVFSCKNQEVNTLDYPWWISGIMMDGLSIVPSKNLVSNIGNYGTHFHSADSVMLFMATDELNMSNIKSFNPVISQNSVYDSEEYKKFFFKPFYTGVGIKILKFTKLFSIARYIYKQIWRVKTN